MIDKIKILSQLEILLKNQQAQGPRNVDSEHLQAVKEDLQLLEMIRESIPTNKKNKMLKVDIGSLVELSVNNCLNWYFITSIKGGNVIKIDDQTVLILSVFSPLGSQVLGHKKGDIIEVLVMQEKRRYKIERLF
jgi:transcription elongation GreA/GreB family factor